MADIELPPTETLPPATSYDMLQQQAADCLNQQQYEEAIALLEQCIDQNPAHLSNYWHLGLAAFLAGDDLTAQTVWFSVLSQAGAEAESWIAELLGLLEVQATRCLQTQDLDTARRLYDQMLELRPDHAEPHLGLGLIAYQENEFEQGVEHFTQFIQQDATFARAFHHLGNCCLMLKRYEEAIASFQQGLVLGDESAGVHQRLGQCLYEVQQYTTARLHLQKAVALEPDLAIAWFYLGCCDAAQKRYPSAVEAFERAIAQQPNFYSACNHLGGCLRDLDRPKQAIEVLNRAIALRPNGAHAYNNLGACFNDLGNFEAAIAALTQAIMLRPNFAEAHSNLGVVYRNLGEIDDAIACFEQALVHQPGLTFAQEQRDQITRCLQAGYFPAMAEAKGAWDTILFQEAHGGYRLMFLVGDRTAYPFWSVGELWSASSQDLKTWTPLGPILKPDPDSYWQSGRILSGTLRHEQGRYYLFYSAAPPGEAMLHESIGLATSEDGIHWRRSPSPLVEPDPAIYRAVPSHVWDKTLEHRAWRDPYLVYDPASQQYYLFTSACCHGDNPHYSGCVGLAVSDRIDGPYRVCPPAAYPCLEGTREGLFYELERPQVFHHDGLYHLFFSLTHRMINPTWLDRVGRAGITNSTLYWFISKSLAGPYQAAVEKPIVAGSDRTGLYGTQIVPGPDGQLYAFGAYHTSFTLEVSPRFPLRWRQGVPEIVV